jgi:hypothetical protein
MRGQRIRQPAVRLRCGERAGLVDPAPTAEQFATKPVTNTRRRGLVMAGSSRRAALFPVNAAPAYAHPPLDQLAMDSQPETPTAFPRQSTQRLGGAQFYGSEAIAQAASAGDGRPEQRWRPMILPLLLVGCCVGIDRLLAPGFGESLALRWLRSVADHPLRCALALGLLHSGLATARTHAGPTAGNAVDLDTRAQASLERAPPQSPERARAARPPTTHLSTFKSGQNPSG